MWLLMLASPLQGYAASTMLLGGAGHHGAAPAAAAASGHDHASHTHAGATVEAGASVAGPQPSSHTKAANKCSTCAACCVFACLPTALVEFAASTPGSALAVVVLALDVGFFTDGPDRPPRLLPV